MTTVHLTDDETAAFLWFRQHQNLVTTLAAIGLETMRGGQAILNLNPEGVITGVEIRRVIYRRSKGKTELPTT